eukprot:g8098.t1
MREGVFGARMQDDGAGGVVVSVVATGSPGELQGVRVGDRVLELNGAPLPPTYDAAVAAIGAAARPLRLGLARAAESDGARAARAEPPGAQPRCHFEAVIGPGHFGVGLAEGGGGLWLHVGAVEHGSLGAVAGMRTGDHITALNRAPLATDLATATAAIDAALLQRSAASPVRLGVVRPGSQATALSTRNTFDAVFTQSALGFGLSEAAVAGVPRVVVSKVTVGGQAEAAGVCVGDVLVAVQGAPAPAQFDALAQAVGAAPRPAILGFERDPRGARPLAVPEGDSGGGGSGGGGGTGAHPLPSGPPVAVPVAPAPARGVGVLCAQLTDVCINWGATAGYLGLLLVFNIPEMRPASHKLSARIGLLMPLQGLVLLGLSPLVPLRGAHWCRSGRVCAGDAPRQRPAPPFFAADPVARLCAMLTCQVTGNLSYAQYVFQMLAYTLFPAQRFAAGDVLAFFLFLLPLSWVCAVFVHEPAKRAWSRRVRQSKNRAKALLRVVFGPAVCVAVVLAAATGAHHARVSSGAGDVVIAAGAAVDVSLLRHGWAATAQAAKVVNPQYASDDSLATTISMALINPSVLAWDDGGGGGQVYVRVARVHAVSQTSSGGKSYPAYGHAGGDATELTHTWHSGIVFHAYRGRPGTGLRLAGWDPSAWRWAPAESQQMVAMPLTSNLAAGADAAAWRTGTSRLCRAKGTWIPANRTMVRKIVNGAEDPKPFRHAHAGGWGVAFTSYPHQAARPGCDGTYMANPQMYVAGDGDGAWGRAASTTTAGKAWPGGSMVPAQRLQCGFKSVYAEKNWIAFTVADQLYFVYSVHPHTVVQARAADGACIRRYATTFGPLAAVGNPLGGYRLSGSATALRWDSDTFVALAHTKHKQHGYYRTFAYFFAAAPPFAVRRVSRALPLHERAFASGLLLDRDAAGKVAKVVVTYGLRDEEPRALVMSDAYFEGMFRACTPAA